MTELSPRGTKFINDLEILCRRHRVVLVIQDGMDNGVLEIHDMYAGSDPLQACYIEDHLINEE